MVFAASSLTAQWLTQHQPDSSVDLSTGLRENWNPRQRWRAAIAAVAATNRFRKSATVPIAAAAESSDTDDDGYGTADEAPASPVSPSQREHDSKSPPDMAAIARDVAQMKV